MMNPTHLNWLAAAARLTPWRRLLRRLPVARAQPLVPSRAVATARAAVVPVSCARSVASPTRASRPDPARQSTLSATPRQVRAMLRVVRIIENDQAPTSSGRIVMCGRMADVCAELDRMVEREAALLPRA